MANQTDFQLLAKCYRNGLVYSYEVVIRVLETLKSLGAETALSKIFNEECSSLADFLIGIIEGNGDHIENYYINKGK